MLTFGFHPCLIESTRAANLFAIYRWGVRLFSTILQIDFTHLIVHGVGGRRGRDKSSRFGASYKSAKRTKSMPRNIGIHGPISRAKSARSIDAKFTVRHKLEHSQRCSE